MKLQTQIEKEIKYLINEADYSKLVSLQNADSIVQINYYFDTCDLWCYQNNVTIRIRQKNDNYELTTKQKTKASLSYHHSIENNIKLSQRMFENYLSKGIEPNQLGLYIGNHLYFIGKLETYRSKLNLGHGVVLDVDKNQYNNTVDYEIELEFEDYSQIDIIEQFLAAQKIDVRKAEYSKFARFVGSIADKL
jgi:uncharacterized protein YjbK